LVKSKRHEKNHLEADVIWSIRNLVWGTVVIALFTGIVFLAYRTKATQPREYEGRIIDKWAGYNHTELGSAPYFKLLIETQNNQRITVSVDKDMYYRVKVGTWIKKTKTGVELGQINPATSRDVAHGSIRCDFESSKSNV
jgi:hypothetical protein